MTPDTRGWLWSAVAATAPIAIPLLCGWAADCLGDAYKCEVEGLIATCADAPRIASLIGFLDGVWLFILSTFWLVLITPVFWVVFVVKWLGEETPA